MSRGLEVGYNAVYRAWFAFRKGKAPTRAIDEFAYNLEANLAELSGELTAGSYRHGSYQAIILREKKRRDLAVAGVRDRVVHRLLYDYLLDKFDNSFDPDVWSCRAGKGLHSCLNRTQKMLQKYKHSYVWRADIIKFFDTVNHQVLLSCLSRKFMSGGPELWLCEEVILSYHVKPAAGIPIGNLTSQLFANIYLNEFDRFVRYKLKPQAYVRYGDDFLLFYPTRRKAFQAKVRAGRFLDRHLRLKINPRNDVVIPAHNGLKFLGHLINVEGSFVDKYTTARIMNKINWRNISSYRALYLQEEAKDCLDWIVLEKLLDTDHIT